MRRRPSHALLVAAVVCLGAAWVAWNLFPDLPGAPPSAQGPGETPRPGERPTAPAPNRDRDVALAPLVGAEQVQVTRDREAVAPAAPTESSAREADTATASNRTASASSGEHVVRVHGVVLGSDNAPVRDAKIYRGSHTGSLPSTEPLATAGPDGSFVLELRDVKARDWRVLLARKRGYGSVAGAPLDWARALRDGVLKDVTVHLDSPCTVRGMVIDEAKRPVANCDVYLRGPIRQVAGRRVSTTDAKGRFAFDDLPSKSFELQASRRSNGNTHEFARSDVFGLAPGQVREGLVLQLRTQGPTGEVSGVVLRESDGAPLKNLAVTLRFRAHPDEDTMMHTDDEGRFRFRRVHPDVARVEAKQRGGWEGVLATDLQVPATGLVFTCDALSTVTIRGTVEDDRGDRVPRCKLRLQAGGDTLVRDVLDGAFSFEFPVKLPVSFWILAPQNEAGEPTNLLPAKRTVRSSDDTVAVQLRAGATIAGRVVDEVGHGVPDVGVRGSSGNTTKTSPTGQWRLVGLEHRAHDVQVEAPAGYLRPPPTRAAPGESDIVIRLGRGVSIAGRVVAPDGVVVDRGIVTARWKLPGAKSSRTAQTSVARGGAFEIRGVPRGPTVSLRALVSEPGSEFNRLLPEEISGVRAGAQDVVLPVRLGLEIAGTVLGPDGKPVSSGFVSARREDGRSTSASIRRGGRFRIASAGPCVLRILMTRHADREVPVTPPVTDLRIRLAPKKR